MATLKLMRNWEQKAYDIIDNERTRARRQQIAADRRAGYRVLPMSKTKINGIKRLIANAEIIERHPEYTVYKI